MPQALLVDRCPGSGVSGASGRKCSLSWSEQLPWESHALPERRSHSRTDPIARTRAVHLSVWQTLADTGCASSRRTGLPPGASGQERLSLESLGGGTRAGGPAMCRPGNWEDPGGGEGTEPGTQAVSASGCPRAQQPVNARWCWPL